jgi:HD superfamily phosphodiesterase
MAITDQQRQQIALFARSYILRSAETLGQRHAQQRASARWVHTLNVSQNVRQILDGEKAAEDVRDVCEVAAILHDIDHYTVELAYHAQRGAETATKFLQKEGHPSAFIKRVVAVIRGHHLEPDDDVAIEEQVEEIMATHSYEDRIIMDADTLDKIGVSNILLTVVTMVQNGSRMADIARELTSGWPLQRASLWKQMLTTFTGKRIGEARYAFYEQVMRQIASEIMFEDPYPQLSQTQELRTIAVAPPPDLPK